jgi:hypothetical protein
LLDDDISRELRSRGDGRSKKKDVGRVERLFMSGTLSRRFGRWVRRHEYVSAASLIGAVSFISFIVGAAAASWSDSLNFVAGAIAAILLFGLFVSVPISIGYSAIQTWKDRYPDDSGWRAVAKGLRDGIAVAAAGVASFIYALVALALFLLGLFVVIWLIKHMWEAA